VPREIVDVLRLRTFGGLSIERSSPESGSEVPPSSATAARRRLAVLAVLAAHSPHGVPRDKLLAFFWPESDSDRARHALDQTLYVLKRDLGAESLVVGREEPALNPAAITSDVGEFKAALARGERASAIELYTGPFLDGVFISGAPEFERWVEEERSRLTREVELALEALAVDASKAGDHTTSVQRWQRLAVMEPRKTRVVLALMTELAAAGDRANALRHAEIYHTLVKDDLETMPNPAVAALAEKLKREPAPRPKAAAPAPPAPPPVSQAAPRASLTVEWLRQRTARAYRIAAAAVSVVVLLGLSLAWVLASRRQDLGRAWLLAADVENHTNDAVFDYALDAALTTGLQQSPDVNLFPRARVQQTLIRMTRSPASRLDEGLAREVAEREGIRIVLVTAIDRVDSTYMLTARLVDASSGVAVAAESRVAQHRGDVIPAIDDLVRRIRHDIGESTSTIARHDLPLPQATTASLEALRKYADGLAASAAGQRTIAMELWREAVALDTNFALAHAELGAAYYWNNDRPQGDEHFEHALRLLDRLTDRERLVIRASAESSRGNREGAIALRRALLALYPNDRVTWGKIGYDYMRLNRPHEAIAAFMQQFARDSSSPNDHINLALCYRQLHRYEDAIREYHRAFLLQPNLLTSENLNHEYGTTLVAAGHLAEARAVFGSMLGGDPGQQARGHRSAGLLAMVQGRYAEAIDHFQHAILLSQAPGNELTHARNRLFLAAAEQEKGWTDSARTELRTAYGLFRKSYFEPAFLTFLGKALVRDGQLALAVEVLDSLRRRSRLGNEDDRINEGVLAAEVALANGRADSAMRLLRVAYATDSNAFIMESLAHAMAASGDAIGSAQLYAGLGSRTESWFGWEAEQFGLTAPAASGALYERLGDRTKARAAYEHQLAQWSSADPDLLSLRRARAALSRLRGLDFEREIHR
jgi:DNA-binding SARP family transcriptional activator/tetratricopeptide (TPR) repeat protein